MPRLLSQSRLTCPKRRRVRVRTLPAVEVVSAIHRGPYTTLGETIEAVIQWTEANGYRIIGPEREIYLQPGVRAVGRLTESRSR